MSQPKISFDLQKITLALDQLLPVRQIKDARKSTTRYDKILASIKEVGVIEPLMVYPQQGGKDRYLIMDGHYRYYALKELGETRVQCIVSHEDESFTFNARISRLAPIQEHRMITKAVQNGVRPERIASALNITLKQVKATLTLLEGINEEAADLLKDKTVCPKAIRVLKRVSAVRQIEMSEMMVNTNNFTASYAEALFLCTRKEQLVEQDKPKSKSLSYEALAKMEEEMASIESDFKAAEESYGVDVLNFTVVQGYVKRLLENAKVVRFLGSRHGELLPELEKLASTDAI